MVTCDVYNMITDEADATVIFTLYNLWLEMNQLHRIILLISGILSRIIKCLSISLQTNLFMKLSIAS